MYIADTCNLVRVLEVLIDSEEPHAIVLVTPNEEVAGVGRHIACPVGTAALVENVVGAVDCLRAVLVIIELLTVVDAIAAGAHHAVLNRIGGLDEEVAGSLLVVVVVQTGVHCVRVERRPLAQHGGRVVAQCGIGVLQALIVLAPEQIETCSEGMCSILIKMVCGNLIL